MRWGLVGWVLGAVWVSLAGVLALPAALAFALGEPVRPFALAVAVALGLGAPLLFTLRTESPRLGHRDAFLCVSLVWLSVCALGAIPLALYPEPRIPLADALFESVSGFTATGATALSGLDRMPASLLLWRSITQWLGGMGIVLLGVAILPLLGVGGMALYRAEAPGPTKDKLTPRVAETAKLLWTVYGGLTLATFVGFLLAGMNAFDAANHAMTSIATAGFSTHDSSLGFYDSRLVHFVATLAMLTGGTSFLVLHRALVGRASWADQPELRAYLGIFCLATLGIALDLWLRGADDRYADPLGALGHASFQVASILTTTGYSTVDFDLWPAFSHVILVALFLIGGMAGSTSGGPKVIRVVLLWRVAMEHCPRLVHRHALRVVRVGADTVEERVLLSSLGFLAMWIVLLLVGTIALAAAGTDPVSSLMAAAVSLGNIGPGLGEVGPSKTFAPFDTWSKGVMCTLMVLGRLEIYTLLILLTPGFWRA